MDVRLELSIITLPVDEDGEGYFFALCHFLWVGCHCALWVAADWMFLAYFSLIDTLPRAPRALPTIIPNIIPGPKPVIA